MIDTPMKHMSKGTLQKIAVIQAMLGNPDILLMDEPLSGQDMESCEVFVSKINEMKNKGVTIVTACHEPWLANALGDQIIRIHNKKVLISQGKGLEYNIEEGRNNN